MKKGVPMVNRAKDEKKTTKDTKEQKQHLGYGNWLFRKKGTVAEPWPTAEELWNDPEVQKMIKAHNKLVKERRRS